MSLADEAARLADSVGPATAEGDEMRRLPDHVWKQLLEGYEFDRVRFRVAGSTYRAADPAHWLALDVADQALADAGFAHGDGLPRETTGVVLGNDVEQIPTVARYRLADRNLLPSERPAIYALARSATSAR